MTENNASIHVLADETLGGIKREYVEVDRKAEVGEKVIITRKLDCCMLDMKIGSIYEVVRLVEGSHGDVNVIDDTDEEATASFGGYRVLVPVEADEPQPSDLIDVVSNLATRVAGLERKDAAKDDLINKALSDVYTRIGRLHDEIDTLHKDNRTLGEELARLKQGADTPQPNVDMMAEAFAALKRAGL